ncbi:MAG: metallophosphoesterase family protein, partial [Chloroflexota bacterium]
MVSDTHISVRARHLPAPLLAALRGVDLILHAGDLVALSVLDELATVAPVEAVHGNVDGWEVINALPRTRIVQAGGKRIGLVHGDGAGSSTLLRAK